MSKTESENSKMPWRPLPEDSVAAVEKLLENDPWGGDDEE